MNSRHPFEQFMKQNQNINNNEYYEILGIEKNASESQIKKAFRKKAIKTHPDRGGDIEKFKKLSEAYEVLSDKTKKEKYDKYGKDGLNSNGINPTNIYEMFSGRHSENYEKKGTNITHHLKIPLESFYTGATKKLSIQRSILSDLNKKPTKCIKCNGIGVISKIKEIGIGLMQQVQTKCTKCDGSGYLCDFINDKKIFTVVIEKGVPNGKKIKFENEGNHIPNGEPGDIIIILTQKEHPIFTRKNNNLYMNKNIYLSEALSGTKFILNHLDNRKLLISSKNIITPDLKKMVINEGMPIHENPFSKGNLIITFTTIYPRKLISSLDIKNILPMPPTIDIPNNAELYNLENFHIDKEYENQKQVYDSDDEDFEHSENMHEGQGVQCAQS